MAHGNRGETGRSDSLESVVNEGKKTSPQFAVGIPVFLELVQKRKRLRTQAQLVGWVRPRILITSVPQDSRLMMIPKGTELVVRYLLDGKVYGFITHLLQKQSDPLPLWMMEYPELVEIKNLRRSPRVPITIEVKTHMDETWYTVDLSAQGACLTVDSEQKVGDLLLLNFTLPDGQEIDNLSATIVRSYSEEHSKRVGIQFDDSCPEELEKITNYLSGVTIFDKS